MFGARTQGILFAIAAAVCYGLNPLGAKSLYAAGLTADSVLFYRYALAAALLGAWVAWRGEGFRLTRRECAWAAALGGCFGLSSLAFFASFAVMDSGLACALLFVYPAMVAAIMALCFGERLGAARAAALAGGIGGVALLWGGAHAAGRARRPAHPRRGDADHPAPGRAEAHLGRGVRARGRGGTRGRIRRGCRSPGW